MVNDYKKLLSDFLNNKRLVLISNRGPYNFSRNKNGKLVENRGGGGLVSALLSLLADIDVEWYSVARSDVDAQIGLKGMPLNSRKKSKVKFIEIDKKTYSSFYNNMCNEIFWFVQHSLWDNTYQPVFGSETTKAWEDYKTVNQLFAEAVWKDLAQSKRRPTFLMFQDYHLYTAASFMPKASNVYTSHFTHIPWPSPDIISALPKEILVSILEGLLSHDLIGFHCESYAHNFIQACELFLQLPVDTQKQMVRFEDRWIPVKAFPISIDSASLLQEASSKPVCLYEQPLKSKKQFIFRADRIDPSKNIVRGFLSFKRMLELAPELKGKVHFIAYLYESRNEINYYRQYLKEIKKTVDNINRRFATSKWKPIHLRLADNYYQTLAAYKYFDVLLVNSIADGMNLVAKEGPVLNTNDGVVILSAKTGAFNELGHFCLPINPFDIDETALTLKKALAMPKKERATRSSLLKSTIRTNNSAKWLYYQLECLMEKNPKYQIPNSK